MYPANWYGILFGYNDLPDEVIVPIAGLSQIIATKQNSSYLYQTQPVSIGSEQFLVYQFRIAQVGLEKMWVGRVYNTLFPEPPVGVNDFSAGISPCLFSATIDGGIVEDNFADFYTINFDFTGEDESIKEAVTVYRRSLCVWDGPDSCGNIVELYFNPIDTSVEGSPQRLARWTIAFQTNVLRQDGPCTGGVGFILDKAPPNNSPIGEYGNFEEGAGAKIE